MVAATAHRHLALDVVAHVRLDETEHGVRDIARANDSDVSGGTSGGRSEIGAGESVQHRNRRRVLDLGLKLVHWFIPVWSYTGVEPTAI